MKSAKWFFLLAYLATMLPSARAVAQGPPPVVFDPDHVYKIINVKTGKCLEIAGGKDQVLQEGRTTAIWPYWGVAKQQWYIRDAGDGHWYIINRNSALFLEEGSIETDDDHRAKQWYYNWYSFARQSSTATKWVISRTSANQHYALSTRVDNKTRSLTFTDVDTPPSDSRPMVYPHVFCNGSQDWDIIDVSINSSVFSIENVNSNKALEIGGADMNGGAFAQQWSYYGLGNQQWIMNQEGSDNGRPYFSIVNRNSMMALEIGGSQNTIMTAGTRANQWPYWGGDNQLWYRDVVGNNSVPQYRLINKASGYALEVGAASTNEGARVNQWDSWDGPNQLWWITYISANRNVPTAPPVNAANTKTQKQ